MPLRPALLHGRQDCSPSQDHFSLNLSQDLALSGTVSLSVKSEAPLGPGHISRFLYGPMWVLPCVVDIKSIHDQTDGDCGLPCEMVGLPGMCLPHLSIYSIAHLH